MTKNQIGIIPESTINNIDDTAYLEFQTLQRMELSVGLYNVLKSYDLRNLKDISTIDAQKFPKFRHMGRVRLTELYEVLKEYKGYVADHYSTIKGIGGLPLDFPSKTALEENGELDNYHQQGSARAMQFKSPYPTHSQYYQTDFKSWLAERNINVTKSDISETVFGEEIHIENFVVQKIGTQIDNTGTMKDFLLPLNELSQLPESSMLRRLSGQMDQNGNPLDLVLRSCWPVRTS